MTPKIAAIVPMRHDSERVPGKNYRLFAGKPLFHYIIETLLDCPNVNQVVIDTDSPTIMADGSRTFPGVTFIERPEHLRDGRTPMNDVLMNSVNQVEADFYLQTHSTNPLLTSQTIETAINRFVAAWPVNDSLFSVTRIQSRLWDALGRAINHNPAILLRTQDLPPVYEENSCLYLFARSTLETRHNRIGEPGRRFAVLGIEKPLPLGGVAAGDGSGFLEVAQEPQPARAPSEPRIPAHLADFAAQKVVPDLVRREAQMLADGDVVRRQIAGLGGEDPIGDGQAVAVDLDAHAHAVPAVIAAEIHIQ